MSSIRNADDREDDENNEIRYRQLALINPPEITAAITSRYTDFTLPEGWQVEEVPRATSSIVDKYYYEPGTGKKFRSLRAVERYVNGEDEKPLTLAVMLRNSKKRSGASGFSRKIIFDGKMVKYTEGMTESEMASLAARKTAAKSHYNLPDGWVVEEVPRRHISHTDKYYYEPGTWRKFRSLRTAESYIYGKDALYVADTKYQKRSVGSGCSRKRIIFDGKLVNYKKGMTEGELANLAASKKASISHYNLPDGWVVEEVPRRNSPLFGAHTDKYYYEPGTGVRFRSLSSAQKHVAESNEDNKPLFALESNEHKPLLALESNEDKPLSALVAEIKDLNRPLAKVFKLPQSVKKEPSCTKKPASNSEQIPEKVEWVIDTFQDNAYEWRPFVCDRAVPPSLVKEWRERFHLAMQTNKG